MANAADRGESRISADGRTIRDWADEHDPAVVPVRRPADRFPYALVPADRTSDEDAVPWDEFVEALDRHDAAVVYRGPGHEDPFEVTGQEVVVERSAAGEETVQEALLDGETVTTEVTETTVVERTVVEEAELESEVTGREVVDERIVGGKLRSREFDCAVDPPDSATVDRDFEPEQFQAGHRWDERLPVEVRTRETWLLTKEVFERVTVETEVVGMDVTETDTVQDDTVEREVDVEGVQRDILDSGLVETDTSTTEVIESGSIESETTGQDVHTTLVERRTYDDEVTLRRRYAGTIPGETTAADTVDSELVASSLVGGDEVEFEMETVVDTATGVETSVEGEGSGTDDHRPGGDAAGSRDDSRTGSGADQRRGSGASSTSGRRRSELSGALALSDEDTGKTVVDAAGERVGIVTGVGEGALYVDPHPSLTDRLRSALGWGSGVDARDQPIYPDRIDAITETRVELVDRVHPDTESP